MLGPTCTTRRKDGHPCNASPMRDLPFCFWHAPEKEEEVAEARRTGGYRRRKERTLTGAYDVGPLDSVEGIRRIFEIVVFNGLSLEISIAQGRLLISAGLALAKLLEVGELADRVAALEALRADPSSRPPGSIFPDQAAA